MATLAELARSAGIAIEIARLGGATDEAGATEGEQARSVDRALERVRRSLDELLVAFDLVLVCAGAWAANLVPELAPLITPNGQPVFHLRPDEPALFAPARFPVFGADISRTGYYGFPANDEGIVKIANHGTGTHVAITPEGDAQRGVHPGHEAALRRFLAETFPVLARAPIVDRRLCVYADTSDGHFLVAHHPTTPNLVVATGGSGHAFKFAPVLGALIADIALGEPHPLAKKFAWRSAAPSIGDAARHK